MRTRGQISTSHCVALRVFIEVFTEILKYDPIDHSDLRSVASTCRRLRLIARPLMDQEMHIVSNRKASFDPLIFMGKNKQRGELLRILFIDVPDVYAASPKVYIPSLLAALPTFINLTSISLPSPLINDTVFSMVYTRPTIEILGVLGHLRQQFNTLDLGSRVPLPRSRASPLKVPKLEAGFSLAEINFLEQFLDFFQFHSVVVPALWFGFQSAMVPPSLLTSRDIRDLEIIYFKATPIAFYSAFNYLERVMATQTSLQTVSLGLRDWESPHGFQVGPPSWRMFVDGAAVPPSFDFTQAWSGVRVRCIDTDFSATGPGGDFVESGLRIRFVAGTRVTSRMIRELARQTDTFAYMFMAEEDDLRWPDWHETISVMALEMSILGVIYLNCSLTPTPTVTTTLACSQSCYNKLASSHPAHYAASELVGGHLEVWRLSYNIHVARLRLLDPVFADGKYKVLQSKLGTEKGLIVEIAADVGDGEDGEWEIWVDKLDEVSTEEKVKRCRCFGCGEVEEGEDPISALMECNVEEVRAALVVEGFNLDAFDAKSSTSPIDQHSFESFLRSNA